MKWVKEKDEQLISLVDNGLKVNDIMEIMNLSYKSITSRFLMTL